MASVRPIRDFVFSKSNSAPVPVFVLTKALSNVIKAFQKPIWAEQTKQRLNLIKLLSRGDRNP